MRPPRASRSKRRYEPAWFVGFVLGSPWVLSLARAAPTPASWHSAASAKAPSKAAVRDLPMLPSVTSVDVRVGVSSVVLIEDVLLPRGDWQSEPLAFYVAFGAPSVPRAFDARLFKVAEDGLSAESSDVGEALAFERAPRRPAFSYPLLGSEKMAGVVVRIAPSGFVRAMAPSNAAVIRLRSVLDAPQEDAFGLHGIVVRLGASRGNPLTLGRIVVKSDAVSLGRVEARLCGPEADPHALALTLVPTGPKKQLDSWAIHPTLAVRRATDDLCIRYAIDHEAAARLR